MTLSNVELDIVPSYLHTYFTIHCYTVDNVSMYLLIVTFLLYQWLFSGFHEAVADIASLSFQTPEHLHTIGLIPNLPNGTGKIYKTIPKFTVG